MDFKHLGLISIIFSWLNIFYALRRWKGDRSLSISQHVAQSKLGIIYYFLVFAIALPPFAVFIFNWFIPEFNLSGIFSIFVWIAILGQALAVTIPETKGWHVPVHRFMAFLMSFALAPLMVLIGLNQNIHAIARIIAVFAAFYMLIIQVTYNLNYKPVHNNLLIAQATYVALFHISIIAATYL